MVTGLIVDHYGFLMLEIFFIIWLAGEWRGVDGMDVDWGELLNNCFCFFSVSLIATMVIYLYDYHNKGILNMSPSERSHHPNNM